MAFVKTGIAFKKPTPVTDISQHHIASTLPVGEEKDGKVWDGDKWVAREEWEKTHPPKEG